MIFICLSKNNAVVYFIIFHLLFTGCNKDYLTEEINYNNNEVAISARIYKPTTNGKLPAVVLVPSADPDTKKTYSDYAEYFASQGIVALTYDKRGAGKSTGNVMKADFEDLLQDALSGIQYLKGLDYIDTNKMGFLGNSQGGMYIFMADSISDDVAFLINISGSPGTPLEQSDYNIYSKTISNGASKEYADSLVSLMHDYIIYLKERKNYASIKNRYDLAIVNSQKPIADKINYFSQFTYLAPPENLPPYNETEMFPFMRSYDFKPGRYYTKLAIPALIIYGKHDRVITAAERYEYAKSLAQENKNIEVRLYENANHSIKEKSKLGLHYPDNYFEDITKWIKSH